MAGGKALLYQAHSVLISVELPTLSAFYQMQLSHRSWLILIFCLTLSVDFNSYCIDEIIFRPSLLVRHSLVYIGIAPFIV